MKFENYKESLYYTTNFLLHSGDYMARSDHSCKKDGHLTSILVS